MPGAYGWIGGIGAPPEPHFDVMLLTEQNLLPGDIVMGYIRGVCCRGDGDHKFVALNSEQQSHVAQADLAALDAKTMEELWRLYPHVYIRTFIPHAGENEGWFGAEVAQTYLVERIQSTIYQAGQPVRQRWQATTEA